MKDYEEREIICKGCGVIATEKNKDIFVKKSGSRGLANQCKPCMNTEKRTRYNKQKVKIKGCIYKGDTNLVIKVISY